MSFWSATEGSVFCTGSVPDSHPGVVALVADRCRIHGPSVEGQGIFWGWLDFKGKELRRAIEETLKVRGTPLPSEAPLALTAAFSDDAEKQAQWRGFLSKNKLEAVAPSLAETCRSIALFLDPVLHVLRTSDKLNSIWPAGGPWRASRRGEGGQ